MDYSVEFGQVGSRGTVLAETSFGLEFTFDTLITPKLSVDRRGRRRVVGERRHRVVKLLSPCCGATYEVVAGLHRCHSCSQEAAWPEAQLEFEMASDSMEATNQWEPILKRYFSEYLESQLIAFSLHASLMEVVAEVEGGRRVRSLVRKLAQEAER